MGLILTYYRHHLHLGNLCRHLVSEDLITPQILQGRDLACNLSYQNHWCQLLVPQTYPLCWLLGSSVSC